MQVFGSNSKLDCTKYARIGDNQARVFALVAILERQLLLKNQVKSCFRLLKSN